MCFPLLCSFFCAICMQAMTHSVDNVPSQQAVKLVVVGSGFVEHYWFGLFLGDQRQWKIGEMALQSVTLTLKLSLKMPYFPDRWGKLQFCYLQDRRFYQMEAHVFQNFFLRWDLPFPKSKVYIFYWKGKGEKSNISCFDWRHKSTQIHHKTRVLK